MIARFDDTVYPIQPITHTRMTARALLIDEHDNFLFLQIKGNDEFGVRDHYETIGGGVEQGETLIEAILREVDEEAGYSKAEIVMHLGAIEDTYYLIGRRTLSHFFVVRIQRGDKGMSHPTREEEALFGGLVWMKQEEVASTLDLDLVRGTIGELIHRRDLCAFEKYQREVVNKEMMQEKLNKRD